MPHLGKKGTFNNMKVKHYKAHGETNERVEEFIKAIKALDKKHSRSKTLLAKDPEKYHAKYKEYRDSIRKESEKLMSWIGADKKVSIGAARKTISKFRNAIEEIEHSNDYFIYLLKLLKEENPRHKRVFEALEGKSGTELSKAISFIKEEFSDRLPDALKKKIFNLPYKHPALRYVKLTKSMSDKFRKQSETNAQNKHKKPLQIKIFSIIKTAELIIERRNSVEWYVLVAAVIALTGRRPIEVVKTGSFTKASKDQHLTFYGQAKIRGREDEPKEIPVIGSTPKEIIDAVKIIRAEHDYSEHTNTEVNNSVSQGLNTKLRTHFNNDEIDPRTLRAIYTMFVDKFFYDKYGTDVSKPLYLSTVLGHSEDDVITQTRYSWIKPDWSEVDSGIDVEEMQNQKNQKALQKLIDIIEASRPAILRQQIKKTIRNPYEELADWLVAEMKDGRFINKTRMERPDGVNCIRSRQVIEKFIKALGMSKGWPKKIEEVTT